MSAVSNEDGMNGRIWTAALIVIGDEILSGRTQDKNVAQVARWLNIQGIRLKEVRIVADEPGAIGEAPGGAHSGEAFGAMELDHAGAGFDPVGGVDGDIFGHGVYLGSDGRGVERGWDERTHLDRRADRDWR